MSIKFLSQTLATALDKELMSVPGFSIDQLMELAGLSVASAIESIYKSNNFKNVLIICGPGNNGGDGLVAARHLKHFGYEPTVLYPKQKKGNQEGLFNNLVYQLESLDIPVLREFNQEDLTKQSYQMIVDGMFGFSFKGTPRAPFDSIIQWINTCTCKVVCIDIPSGWDVDNGPQQEVCIKNPSMLVSLTAPKPCASLFKGEYHALGGRFVPPTIAKKYDLEIPPYAGSSQFYMYPKNEM